MMNIRYMGFAAVAAVAGCAWLPSVGPDYTEPELRNPVGTLPDAGMPTSNLTATCEYEPADKAHDDRVEISTNQVARWWTRFEDPLLEELVEGAVSNNITYLMAQRRFEQANWELLGTYAAYVPRIGLDGSWSRLWNHENTRGGGGAYTHYNVRNFAVDGSWEIDIFGGNRRMTEAALAQAESMGWTVADAWLALTSEIGLTYVDFRTTQDLLDVSRTNLLLQSETYEILKSRLESGIGDELAVNQCAYIVEQTRSKIPSLLAEEERYKNALAILIGEMPGALHDRLNPIANSEEKWFMPLEKISSLKLDMMRGRPDVKAAERALAAQTARIGVAKAQWFPKLFVTGTVGWENRHSSPLFARDSFMASLGPSISWPIFQGGAVYSKVKETEARMAELMLAYELALDKAYEDVRNCYSAYTQEYHRYKALGAAVKAASDAVLISRDLYKNGLKDFNNVLDAQRSRLQLQYDYVQSRGNITRKLILLYRALGGGLSSLEE